MSRPSRVPSTVRMLLALSLAASACKTSDENDVSQDSPAGSPEPTDDPTKIELECTSRQTLPDADIEAIESFARTLVDQLEAGKLEAVWSSLHPQARRDDQKAPFMKALETMQARLNRAKGEPRLEHLYQIDVEGGVNDMARVFCDGEPGDADTLTLLANVGNEDLALVTLLVTGDPFGYAVSVQMRKRGDAWGLVGVQVNPASYQGKSAAAFEGLGDSFARAQKLVAAFLAYGVAQTLASRGTSVSTPDKRRISEKLSTTENNQLFDATLGSWTVGEKSYPVLGLSLVSTQADIAPIIKYVTPGGLVRDVLELEADQLLGYVQDNFPELERNFDSIVFEAYAEAPSKKGKSYDAFRVARAFEPSEPDRE